MCRSFPVGIALSCWFQNRPGRTFLLPQLLLFSLLHLIPPLYNQSPRKDQRHAPSPDHKLSLQISIDCLAVLDSNITCETYLWNLVMGQPDLDPHGEQVESEDEHQGSDVADSMWEYPFKNN